MWFNDVETKPGIGYPKRWEDQEQWRGGWELDRKGRLRLRRAGALRKLANIFFNPDLPSLDDYYEPWTYDYEHADNARPLASTSRSRGPSRRSPASRSTSSGAPTGRTTSPARPSTRAADPNLRGGPEEAVRLEYERVFMFYLPRICEHCLNPSCVASCPSGAMYKREEDGIVLVDQEACRGWRMCVSGCPYKKVYFNWRTGKAEKCTLCYPRIEAGKPTICSETCVGRIRYLGVVLYDADRVEEAASVPDERDLLDAQLGDLPRPDDPEVARAGRARDGIPDDWLDAAAPLARLRPRGRAPRRAAAPPRVPHAADGLVRAAALARDGPGRGRGLGGRPGRCLPGRSTGSASRSGTWRTCSPPATSEVVRGVLQAPRRDACYMRERYLGGEADAALASAVGIDVPEIDEMYRLLALAKFNDRFVIPQGPRRGRRQDGRTQQGGGGFESPLGPGPNGGNLVPLEQFGKGK